jgi:membrane-associated protease RseP (regulator of RpoE activity)
MGAAPEKPRGDGHETRLLLITIAVSLAALFVLSRFRAPQGQRAVSAQAPPLERLAARATYDELAAIVVQVQKRLAPQVVVLRATVEEQGIQRARFLPAIRVRPDTVIALMPPSAVVEGLAGDGSPATLLADDPLRSIAAFRVPVPPDAATWLVEPEAPIPVPAYVVVAEATRGGATFRPVFLGRTDPVADPRWDRPLHALGGTLVTQPGALLFSLAGRFLGIAVAEDGGLSVLPADGLLRPADMLASGRSPERSQAGVVLQEPTPGVRRAAGARQGAVIARVAENGPASGVLQPGDVLTSVGGTGVDSVEHAEALLARAPPGSPLGLTVRRAGVERQLSIVPRPFRAARLAARPTELGALLRAAPRGGLEVTQVAPGSLAAAAGLAVGDVVTHVDGGPATAPAAFMRAFQKATRPMVLAVERRGRPLVLALERP